MVFEVAATIGKSVQEVLALPAAELEHWFGYLELKKGRKPMRGAETFGRG